ncbi:MAG: hypothetical protein Q9171_001702 [Xanthocarpia ochracea]
MIASSLSVAIITTLLTLNPVSGSVIPSSISSIFAREGPGGINKAGSSQCFWEGRQGTIPALKFAINKIKVGTRFVAGEKIACASYDTAGVGFPDHNPPFNDKSASGICAFLCEDYTPEWYVGNSTNGNNNLFADVIGDLEWVGATDCGTAPLIRTGPNGETPGPNDLSTGCISVNYVTDVCEAILGDPCKGM